MSAPYPNLGALASTHDASFLNQGGPASFTYTEYDIMDGLNECRRARVAELLDDFRTLQHHITDAPSYPGYGDDFYSDGWTTLRQCAVDGRHILECAADTRVPVANGGQEEQTKAELKQVLLDAFSRRHEAQKIFMRQGAAKRWLSYRDIVLQNQHSHPAIQLQQQLDACDDELRAELASITDESVYNELAASDYARGRWTDEDPSLRSVLRWLRARQQ
ncbi:uncharacterized protein MAM_07851 [Metarhizium album ARSEF 1941]|uniref:Uncharacterized protein n=1 Tax=Metarhizium album (strain ARSEF 1941) TaxID=1081103 RepID=A0A0B2WLH1_METAS|nr:uncharacterized protein MAM_07851 [Metarhizium album ARSEF 1941]KHN94322.1 hypothetical protein MAM_07851 [Metarhizium album ARSEF 1941]